MDLFGMINSFLNPEAPYEAAQDALNRQWSESKGFLQPYMQHGNEQYSTLMDAIKKLMNPAEMQNEWSSQYETSPYAKRLMDMNRQRGLEEASSMGLMGSSGALSNINQGSSDIQSRDRQQFLNDLMQKYMSGIGLSSDIYGSGSGAAGNLAGLGQTMGQNMAGLEYGKEAAPGQMFGKLLGMGLGMAGMGMPGMRWNMLGENKNVIIR